MKKIYFLFYLFLFYFYYHRLSDLSNKHFSQIWSLEFQHQYTSRFRVWWEPTFWLTDVLLLSVSSHGGRAGVLSAAAAKSLQSCPTLCDLIDGSPPGSPVPGILQARTLEWVAISFSNAGKWKVKVKSLSHVRPSATPWTAAFQAHPSMGFSRQEYWSGVPLPSP